jgi:hypothetical protein
MSRHQEAGQKHNRKTAKRSFPNVEKLIYFGMAVTNKNLVHEEIKSRLNSGNARCNSFRSLSSSRLQCKNIKMKICKTIILAIVVYGYGHAVAVDG